MLSNGLMELVGQSNTNRSVVFRAFMTTIKDLVAREKAMPITVTFNKIRAEGYNGHLTASNADILSIIDKNITDWSAFLESHFEPLPEQDPDALED